MKPRRNLPTLVHHGRARAAHYHVLTTQGDAVADLYVPGRARAKRLTLKLATALGRQLQVREERPREKSIGRHPLVGVAKPRASKVRANQSRRRATRGRARPSAKQLAARRRFAQFARTGRWPKKNPAAELHEAAGMFRRWHGFGHARVRRVRAPAMPRLLVELGQVHAIEYWSDKWTGRRELYRHVTDRRHKPRLYTGPRGRGFYLRGGRMLATARGLVH